jgi:hypothetical protein
MHVPDKKYSVVFSGRIKEGQNIEKVRKRLATVFRADIEKIITVFKGEGSVVRRDIDYQTALKYVQAIQEAGALCSIVEMMSDASKTKPSSKPVRSAEKPDKKKLVVYIKLDTANPAFSPVVSHRITGWSEGINLNRSETQKVFYGEITLISVFKVAELFQEEYRLVFFLKDKPRPYVIDANLIAYADFPVEKGVSTVMSLRNFLKFLCTRNRDTMMDEDTAAFLSGKQPMILEEDIVLLTTALACELPVASVVPGTQREAGMKAITEKKPETARSGVQDQRVAAQKVLKAITSKQAYEKSLDDIHSFDAVEAWCRRRASVFGILLIAGFFWPLLNNRLLYDSVVIWPWQIMGIGTGVEEPITSDLLGGGRMVAWSLLPLLAGIIVLLVNRLALLKTRIVTMVLTGSVVLSVLLILLSRESGVLGLMYIPRSPVRGIIIFVIIASAGLVAAMNHLRKTYMNHPVPRILSIIGGILLFMLICFFLVSASGIGKSWPIIMISCLILLYAASAVVSGILADPFEPLFLGLSILVRFIIILIPVVFLLLQTYPGSSYAQFVTEGRGLFLNNFITLFKFVLIYYLSAFLMATGLAGILTVVMGRPASSG